MSVAIRAMDKKAADSTYMTKLSKIATAEMISSKVQNLLSWKLSIFTLYIRVSGVWLYIPFNSITFSTRESFMEILWISNSCKISKQKYKLVGGSNFILPSIWNICFELNCVYLVEMKLEKQCCDCLHSPYLLWRVICWSSISSHMNFNWLHLRQSIDVEHAND